MDSGPAMHRRDDTAADAFFSTSSAPIDLSECEDAVSAFLSNACFSSVRIALVTSGGTAAPLERAAVRFIDNFSTGARGSCLAERLLRRGYAVVFLHRKGSKQPYSRLFIDAANAHAEALTGARAWTGSLPGSAGLVESVSCTLRRVQEEAGAEITAGLKRLLSLQFVSVDDYLWKLRTVSTRIHATGLGKRAVLILAAAVSDFFIPPDTQPEHKIQSDAVAGPGGSGTLTLTLHPVPKVMHMLKAHWAKESMVVSFKLETDEALLVPKAVAAIVNSGVDAVVANLLSTRYTQVTVITNPLLQSTALGSCMGAHESPVDRAGCSTVIIERAIQAVSAKGSHSPMRAHVTRITTTVDRTGGTPHANAPSVDDTLLLPAPLEDALASTLLDWHTEFMG